MSSRPTLGLIAGSGELPLYFAQAAKQKGYSLITVAIRGAATKRLTALSDKILWISLGQLGSLLSFFKKNNVHRTVMQGKVEHSQVFKNPRMDLKMISLWVRLKDRSGEGILKAVAVELQKNGVTLMDSRFLMGDKLARPGWLTRTKATALDRETISYGFKKARLLAKLGVGQTLVVKKKAVVAVEGMEGTDETIRRAGIWAGKETIVLKVASPHQDWRFDVPTLGLKTIQSMIKAKARGIVVEAGRTFLLTNEKTIRLAEKNGIFVLVVS